MPKIKKIMLKNCYFLKVYIKIVKVSKGRFYVYTKEEVMELLSCYELWVVNNYLYNIVDNLTYFVNYSDILKICQWNSWWKMKIKHYIFLK